MSATEPHRVSRLLASPKLRLTALAVVLVVASVGVHRVSGGLSPGDVTEAAKEIDLGLAAVAFPLVYAILTLILFPGAILTAASGIVFGAVLGAALSVVGATAGAIGAFLLGRRLGRRDVERIARGRLASVDDWLERRGFMAVLYLRLIPVVPFNALNYVAGATAVRLRSYAAATAVGIIPGAFAYAALGSSIGDPTSPEFIGAATAVVLLALGAPLVDRRLRRRSSRGDDQASAGSGAGDRSPAGSSSRSGASNSGE